MATPATAVSVALAVRNIVLVSWVDGIGNALYRIYMNTVNDFGTSTLVEMSLQDSQKALISELNYETDYWFWVVGEDIAGGLATEAGSVMITTDIDSPDRLIISDIQDAIYEWAYAVTNGTVVWEYGAGSKPVKPFIALNLIGPRKTGFTDSNIKLDGDLDFRQEGMREFTVTVNIYDDDDALSWATKLQASLDNPNYIEQLQAENIGLGNVSGVTDLSQLLETKYERRARFEFIIYKAYNEEYILDVVEDVQVINNIL